MEMNEVQKALGCCGIDTSGAAALLGCSWPTAKKKIEDPSSMTLGEFFRLYGELDDYARDILGTYIDGLRA